MIDWAETFRAGLRLGLTPDAFWRLSLREWRWLARSGPPALGRAELAALMEGALKPGNGAEDGSPD